MGEKTSIITTNFHLFYNIFLYFIPKTSCMDMKAEERLFYYDGPFVVVLILANIFASFFFVQGSLTLRDPMQKARTCLRRVWYHLFLMMCKIHGPSMID